MPWEAQLTNSLAELVQEYLDENRWDTIGDIEVYLARDEQLHTGVFGVASRMESGAPPRRRPHDSLSLPIVPGAPLGEYPPQPDVYAPAAAAAAAGAAARRRPAGRSAAARRRAYRSQPARRHAAAAARAAAPPGRGDAHRRPDQPALRPARGSNIIGRGTDADLQLLDQGISRRHVDIQFDGNFATAYDLGSTNGTTVNGHEISSQVLRHGDVIRVGHTRHRVPPGAWVTVGMSPGGRMNSALALQLMRFGFLALLWLFVLAAMRVIRTDLRTSGQPRIAAPPPARRRGKRRAAPHRAPAPGRRPTCSSPRAA